MVKRFRQVPSLILAALVCLGAASPPQSTPAAFSVASVKPSGRVLGKDRPPSKLAFQPDSIRGINLTLKDLILEAYELRSHQVIAGQAWIDTTEYDIDARSDKPATRQELRRMLQALIADRFRLSFHRETRQMSVYALIVDKGRPKIHPTAGAAEQRAVVFPAFRGDLQDLADLIGIQLSIPTPSLTADPARPHIAAGPPVPVVDETQLPYGIYELTLDLKPEADSNAFIIWQRFLQEHCGLNLESRKSPIPILIIDKATFASPN